VNKKIAVTIILIITTISVMAQKLKAKDKAPEFELKSAQGESISISKYKGKNILLAFFRFAGCPVCNFRMHSLMENYAKMQQQNIEIIAVFESGNEVLATYIKDATIPFAVIGNHELSLYKKYGVQKSILKMMNTMFKKEPKQQMKQGEIMFNEKKYKQDGSMTRMPADFLIDSKGIIQIAHYGKFIGDHIPLNVILK
jgi:thioredoxin-dependent peroxiredoxin